MSAAVALLFTAAILTAQSRDLDCQGQPIITVMPSYPTEQPVFVSQQDIKEFKVGGKPAQVNGWTPLRDRRVELALLIDTGARASLGT